MPSCQQKVKVQTKYHGSLTVLEDSSQVLFSQRNRPPKNDRSSVKKTLKYLEYSREIEFSTCLP